MKNSEVIEVLQRVCVFSTEDEAILYAIKCVQLVPELFETLRNAMSLANGYEGVEFSWDEAHKLLGKAKELSNTNGTS